ncbi:MAG: hypothetical protein U1F49_12855 [Rubrivivax sp.]
MRNETPELPMATTRGSFAARTAASAVGAAVAVAATALFAAPAMAADRRRWPTPRATAGGREDHGDQPGHPLAEAFGGIHHLYANGKALAGYKAGGKSPTAR